MTMVDEAMALMSDGGTWTITPEKQGAADRFIARLREADAAQKRIGELEAIILATRTKAFTEGHAAGMQAAYDGEVTNAALAKARAEGRREGVEERKALLADALSGEGITQGPPKGGPDAE